MRPPKQPPTSITTRGKRYTILDRRHGWIYSPKMRRLLRRAMLAQGYSKAEICDHGLCTWNQRIED